MLPAGPCSFLAQSVRAPSVIEPLVRYRATGMIYGPGYSAQASPHAGSCDKHPPAAHSPRVVWSIFERRDGARRGVDVGDAGSCLIRAQDHILKHRHPVLLV